MGLEIQEGLEIRVGVLRYRVWAGDTGYGLEIQEGFVRKNLNIPGWAGGPLKIGDCPSVELKFNSLSSRCHPRPRYNRITFLQYAYLLSLCITYNVFVFHLSSKYSLVVISARLGTGPKAGTERS
jgi:hypothetical protein